MLDKDISREKFKVAIFWFNMDKTFRSDGFLASLFQYFWDFIGEYARIGAKDSKRKKVIFGATDHSFLALIHQ